MEKVDFKKRDKALYQPKKEPVLLSVPKLSFLMVDGEGDPNEAGGAYQEAVGILYALSYTVKMSKNSAWRPEGYFEYVVAPLEGLWTQKGRQGMDYAHKELLQWTAMIRQPEFVTEAVFEQAALEVQRKKGLDTVKARLVSWEEGLCAQCLHVGSYDDEPYTVERLHDFIRDQGLLLDMDDQSRRHHELYLSDPRKIAPDKLKTLLRLPVKRP